MKRLSRLWILILPLAACSPGQEKTDDQGQNQEGNGIQNGIHLETGLIAAKGFRIVQANCTPCHSAELITQNRATREGWKGMIKWMQEKQNLWDLGENEEVILEYLTKNYSPVKAGRRANLEHIDWYTLEE